MKRLIMFLFIFVCLISLASALNWRDPYWAQDVRCIFCINASTEISDKDLLENTHNHSCMNITGSVSDLCTIVDTTIGNCSDNGSCYPIIYWDNESNLNVNRSDYWDNYDTPSGWDLNEADDFYINGSRAMTGNINIGDNNITSADWISANYLEGQPLDGSIGSGVIWAESVDTNGNINITHVTQLNITYPDLIIRLAYANNTIEYCNITGTTVTVTDNQHSVYYVDGDCTVKNISFATYIATNLAPGGMTDIFNVVAHENSVDVHKGITVKNKETIQTRKTILYKGHLGIVSGMDITTGTFPEYVQGVGKYQFIRTVVDTTAQNSTTNYVELVSHNGSNWAYYNGTGINLTHCDNGTDLISCSTNAYRRYLLFTVGYSDTHDHTGLYQLAALDGTTYANIGACLNVEANSVSYTLPALYDYSAVPIKIYCGKRDDATWTDNFIDLRAGGAGFGSTQDTSIFLTKDGTRALTANWIAGAYNITTSWFKGIFNWTIGQGSEYIAFNGTHLDFNETYLNNTIDVQDAIYNDSMKTYVDAINITQQNWVDELFVRFTELVSQIGNWTLDKNNYYIKSEVDTNISTANTSMKLYADSQDVIFNDSMKSYTDNLDTNTNTSMKLYVDAQDIVYNNSMKSYVDLLNATGLIIDWNETGYIIDWNASGYIINWNSTGLIANWSSSEIDPLWSANYSTFLTHITWVNAVNGTLYLSSNPFSFYNTTNPQAESDPLFTGNFTLYNDTWSSTYNSTYHTWAYNQTIPANAYTDAQDVIYNNSMKSYVDSQDTTYNDSMKSYVDALDTATNNSVVNWVDELFVRFTEIVGQVGNFSAWDKDYNDLINDPAFLTNFTDNLGDRGYTHLTNFTDDILWTSGFNSTGDTRWLTSYSETDPLWSDNFTLYNDTWSSTYNSSYYLYSNPFGFYNSTNPQTENDPLWSDNFTLYNSTWSYYEEDTNCSGDGICANVLYNSDLPLANKTLPYCGNITGASSNLCTLTDTDTDTWWGLNEGYIYNNSNSLDFNETKLNNTITSLDTDTNLTTEDVQDIVGGMTTSNTETHISVDYQDGDGTIDFVVSDDWWDAYNDFMGTTTTDKWCKWNGSAIECNVDPVSDTDTDTNASTACSTDEVLLGNGSCLSSSGFYDDTDTHVKGDDVYLYNDSTTMYFNETKLNSSIDVRSVTSESDPFWTGNQSIYSTTAIILGWNYYNSTDFDINDYYLVSNPFGFYNSTNPQSEADPLWTDNFTLYNSTWSSVYNSSYYLYSNPFSFYNSTNPQTETDPLWTSNDSTVARAGNCPVGQVVMNTTISGVQCDTPSYTIDTDTNASTACSGTTTYLDGEGNCDDISGVYIDETDEGNLNVNSSDYWDDLNIPSDLNYKILIKEANVTDENWIEDSQEGDLNVNQSDWWITYDSASDLNNLILSHWDNISNKFITSVDNIYIDMVGTTATFNETKLNNSIDARAITSETDPLWSDNFTLYNSTWSYYESDTNASTACSTDEVLLGNGSCHSISSYGSGNLSGGGTTNWVAKFTGASTLGDSIIEDDGNVSVDSGTLFVDAVSNRVGIGTTSPGAKLQVEGFVSSDNFRIAYDGATNFAIAQGSQNNSLIKMYHNEVQKVEIATWGTTYFNGGNVGIGTASPEAELEISKTHPSIMLTSEDTGHSDGEYLSGIKFNTSDASRKGVSAQIHAEADGTAGSTDLVFSAYRSDDFREYLRLSNNGIAFSNANVGIGTTNPGLKLTIKAGGTGTEALRINTTVVDAYLDIADDIIEFNRYHGSNSFFSLTTSNAGSWGGDADAGSIKLSPDGSAVLTATVNGKVGIGTTTPQNTLNVIGNINATGYIYANRTHLVCTAENALCNQTDTDTDTNASTACSTEEVLLGNGSCMDIIGYEWITPAEILDVDYEDICSGDACPFAWNISGNDIFPQNLDWDVGIGTANPQNKLNVVGIGNITSNFSVDNNVLFVDATGDKVGIGIVNPNKTLHLYSGAGQATAYDSGTDMIIEDDTNSYISFDAGSDNYGGLLWPVSSDADSAYIDYHTNLKVMRVAVNASERMRIDSLGNVGIGTATPATRLDIDSNSNTQNLRLRGTSESTEIADIYVGQYGELVISTVAGNDNYQYIDMRPNSSTFGVLVREADGTGTDAYLNIFVANESDTNSYANFVVSGSGGIIGLVIEEDIESASYQVGIGTKTPDAKLDVEEDSVGAAEIGCSTCSATGTSAVAFGCSNASGAISMATGSATKASGAYSTAMGKGTLAQGTRSFAAGDGSEAIGSYSFALGQKVTAYALRSYAFGGGTSGFNNTISNSFMVGFGSTPNLFVNGTHVGIGTTTPGSTLHVVGELNVTGLSDDGIGHAVCIKSDGNFGKCTSVVAADGTCTCS